jgi:hypothetical protein
MKSIITLTLLSFIIMQASCPKHKVSKEGCLENGSYEISYNNCLYDDITIRKNNCGNICFKEVVQESRCPSNTNCVWEGCVVIKLNIALNGVDSTFTMGLGTTPNSNSICAPKTVNFQNKKFTLVNVTPYPNSSTTSSYFNYRAIVEVQ